MDRRGVTIGWLAIVCLMALATEATWTERKANERILNRMLRTMNASVSPCKDFHKYSSGRYGEGFDVKPKFLLNEALEEQISPKFHNLFEKLKNKAFKEGSMEEKVFRLYNSCEAARRENRSSNIFLDVLRPDINLSWPPYMPEGRKWPKERFQWLTTLARLSRYGMQNLFFHVSLQLDSEDNRRYVYVIEKALESSEINKNKLRLSAWGIPVEAITYLNAEIYLLKLNTGSVTKRLSLRELGTEHGIDLLKFFNVALDRKLNPNTQIQVNVDYLVALNRLLNSYDQETVAYYLMQQFGIFMTSYQDSTKYPCVVAVRTSMKAACEQLYEKHILDDTHELESEVQRVFEAIKKQFRQRLEHIHLNPPTPYISKLRNKLNTTTLTLGVLDRERSDNYLYDKLVFEMDDDFATMQLKAMDVLGKSEDIFLNKIDKASFAIYHPGHTIEFGRGRTIFIPYDLLVEPFFTKQSHDVFKVSVLGYIIAEQVFKALYPTYTNFDCHHYKEFIALLDDEHLFWDRSGCNSRLVVDNFNWWGIHLVLLNIVHDAYFSPDSGFSQVQPDFTSMTLKQLFFLNIAQNIEGSNFYWWPSNSAPTTPKVYDEDSIYNPVFKMSTYAEAFKCSTWDYPDIYD